MPQLAVSTVESCQDEPPAADGIDPAEDDRHDELTRWAEVDVSAADASSEQAGLDREG